MAPWPRPARKVNTAIEASVDDEVERMALPNQDDFLSSEPAIRSGPLRSSKSPFDKLPVEILSRIFTIGSDDSAIDVFDPSRDGVRLPTLFTATLLTICRRWRQVAQLRSNSHLWQITASISCSTVHLQDLGDIRYGTVPVFKENLTKSLGCDIYATLDTSAADFMGQHRLLRTHAFLVALRMLNAYKNQLALICFYGFDDMLELFVAVLTLLRGSSRLHTLDLSADWLGPADSVNFFDDTLRDAPTRELFNLYFPDFPSIVAPQPTPFPHLSTLSYRVNTDSRDDLKRTQMVFSLLSYHLVRLEINVEPHTVPWSNLMDMFTCCPLLEQLTLRTGVLSGQPIATSPSNVTVAKNMRAVTLRLHASGLFNIFRSVRFPMLQNLDMTVLEDTADIPDTHFTLERGIATVQLLNTFHYYSLSSWGDVLLSRLAAFHADTFALRALTPLIPTLPTNYSELLSRNRGDPSVPLAIGSPQSIKLDSNFPIGIILDALSQIDLASTKRIEATGIVFSEESEIADVDLAVLQESIIPQEFFAPSLQHVDIGWSYRSTPFRFLKFLEHFHAPVLREDSIHTPGEKRPDILLAFSENHKVPSTMPPDADCLSLEVFLLQLQYCAEFGPPNTPPIDLKFLTHPLLVQLRKMEFNLNVNYYCKDTAETLIPFLRALSGHLDKIGKPECLAYLENLSIAVWDISAGLPSFSNTRYRNITDTLEAELKRVSLSRPGCQTTFRFPKQEESCK
jgi:hypothetical protein